MLIVGASWEARMLTVGASWEARMLTVGASWEARMLTVGASIAVLIEEPSECTCRAPAGVVGTSESSLGTCFV